MTRKKKCPVCDSEQWNYDVVTSDGVSICGDCYHEVKIQGLALGLVRIAGGIVFNSPESFKRAVSAARKTVKCK
jgi:hypothetical protein